MTTKALPSWDNDLQQLRAAIATGDPNTILAVLPEPPGFLAVLFKAPDRDAILAGVFPALETDEDRWEIIEAAAMRSIAQPDSDTFLTVMPYIPADMLTDVGDLVARIPDPVARNAAQAALDRRAKAL